MFETKLNIWAKENYGTIEAMITKWEQTLTDLETIEGVFSLSESEC